MVKKFLIIIILINILTFSTCLSVQGLTLRNISEPVTIDWQTNVYIIPEQDLSNLSVRLRNLARYLGSNWPVIVTLPNEQDITDFKDIDGEWRTITTGQALHFVTQQWYHQKQHSSNSYPDNFIDILVRESGTNIYHPVRDVSLSAFCYQLLQQES